MAMLTMTVPMVASISDPQAFLTYLICNQEHQQSLTHMNVDILSQRLLVN